MVDAWNNPQLLEKLASETLEAAKKAGADSAESQYQSV